MDGSWLSGSKTETVLFTPRVARMYDKHIVRCITDPAPGRQLRVCDVPFPECSKLTIGQFALQFMAKKRGGAAAALKRAEAAMSVKRMELYGDSETVVPKRVPASTKESVTVRRGSVRTGRLVTDVKVPATVVVVRPSFTRVSAGLQRFNLLVQRWRASPLLRHCEVCDETDMPSYDYSTTIFVAMGADLGRRCFGHTLNVRVWLAYTELFGSYLKRSVKVLGGSPMMHPIDSRLLSMATSRVELILVPSESMAKKLAETHVVTVVPQITQFAAPADLVGSVAAQRRTVRFRTQTRGFRHAIMMLEPPCCGATHTAAADAVQKVCKELSIQYELHPSVPSRSKLKQLLGSTAILIIPRFFTSSDLASAALEEEDIWALTLTVATCRYPPVVVSNGFVRPEYGQRVERGEWYETLKHLLVDPDRLTAKLDSACRYWDVWRGEHPPVCDE